MPFEIIRNDITTMEVDAIVNAANTALAPGGGVCGAIFHGAGWNEMQRACRAIGHCDCGKAVLTEGFALPARYVIHTPGPIWQGGNQHEAQLLRSCYLSSLQLAKKHKCKSIAFPLISSGIYGYPKAEALRIAVQAIRDFLAQNDMQVFLAVFDRNAVLLSEKRYQQIQQYIDDHYAEQMFYHARMETDYLFRQKQRQEQQELQSEQEFLPGAPSEDVFHPFSAPTASDVPSASVSTFPAPAAKPKKRSLKDLVSRLDDTFSQMLLRLIDEKGMTDVEVYKRANLDRKLFSKIRKSSYNPSKQTAIALAIALRLNLDETKDLLGRAGYALSHSSKFDVIIEYFITEQIYDIDEINQALFSFEQKTLGA